VYSVSYRDLLGTAERIIDMDEQMREVDAILGVTGQKCNARAVERMGKSFARIQTDKKMLCMCHHVAWLAEERR
jgi:hypothetical protein